MDINTLRGKKLQAYAIIKILKFCTGSSAKSYQCKFALSLRCGAKNVESMEGHSRHLPASASKQRISHIQGTFTCDFC